MELFESTVLSNYKDKFSPDFRVKPNLKLFYSKYPHCVHLSFREPDYDTGRAVVFQIAMSRLKRKMWNILGRSVHTRLEWNDFRIYTKNIKDVLDILAADQKEVGNNKLVINHVCTIDIMLPETLAYLKKPAEELYTSVNKVVKKLPYDKYRYKIFWSKLRSEKKNIGIENLSAIAMQLSLCDQVRVTAQLLDEMKRPFTSWQGTFFYAENLDWISMINLIDNRFIKKIEVYKTENEIE